MRFKLLLKFIFILFFVCNDVFSQDKKYQMQQISGDNLENRSNNRGKEIKKAPIKDKPLINPRSLNINYDTANFPLKYEIEINVDDLYNLDVKRDYFFSKLYISTYLDYDSLVNGINGKLYDTSPDNNFRLKYEIADNSYFSGWINQGYLNDSLYNKFSYASEIENNFHHVWDLKNYPFDEQKLKINLIGLKDTSLVLLKSSLKLPSTYNQSISSLKRGYSIKNLNFSESYINSPFDFVDKNGKYRKKVFSVLTFNIEIDRSGSWLFIKLFLGSFLSFFISIIVFMIPTREFESKISLSIGAIFGAIGNRYFVDSAMSGAQVLTKADMLNNIILLLIVFNILIVTLQRSKTYNIPFLEKNDNAIYISSLIFVLSIFFVLIF